MKRIILAAALAIASTLVLASAPHRASAHPSIDIVAANWKFTPGTITAHVNEVTTLRLTSSGGVHGIVSPDLGIANTMILPGKYVTVTFTPKKAGTYVIHCTVFCGAGHSTMTVTIKVVA
jgi:cytochrome c oxidase subunit 2